MPTRVQRSNDAFWWSLFGAGGAAAALLLPVLLLIFGVLIPFGVVAPPSAASFAALVGHPLVALVLFGVVALSLFHWAHRFRFTLYDGLQLKHLEVLIVVFCYGGALVGTVFAAVVLWPF